MQMSNGLVETSYQSNLASLYDNALSACAFLSAGRVEEARSIFSEGQDTCSSWMYVTSNWTEIKDRIMNMKKCGPTSYIYYTLKCKEIASLYSYLTFLEKYLGDL
jgi:hypothetical protein